MLKTNGFSWFFFKLCSQKATCLHFLMQKTFRLQSVTLIRRDTDNGRSTTLAPVASYERGHKRKQSSVHVRGGFVVLCFPSLPRGGDGVLDGGPKALACMQNRNKPLKYLCLVITPLQQKSLISSAFICTNHWRILQP